MASAPLPARPQSLLHSFRDLSLKKELTAPPLASGLPAFDRLTGGFPRGAISEIFGPASSGATTLLNALLAEASTAAGEYCALVDACDAFDPASGAAAGIRLEQLLWVRCGRGVEAAIQVTDLLLHGGGFGVVVLDLIGVPVEQIRRFPLAWWYRFRRAVEGTPAVFAIAQREPYVKSATSLAIEMRPRRGRWSGAHADFRVLRGASFEAGLRKPARSEAAASSAVVDASLAMA